MYYFAKLFTKAPFDLLQLHMEKVIACLVKLDEVLKVFEEASLKVVASQVQRDGVSTAPEGASLQEVEGLAEAVSSLEHEADLIKNEIRSLLPNRFLFSIDRHNFLEILALQDKIADISEDIASLLTMKPLTIPPALKETFRLYKNKNMETAWEVKEIVFGFDELLEVSFGGPVAANMKTKIDRTAYIEHEADVLRHKLTKTLFQIADGLSTPDFYLWMRLIHEIGLISHFSEKLALRIGMLLDLK